MHNGAISSNFTPERTPTVTAKMLLSWTNGKSSDGGVTKQEQLLFVWLPSSLLPCGLQHQANEKQMPQARGAAAKSATKCWAQAVGNVTPRLRGTLGVQTALRYE